MIERRKEDADSRFLKEIEFVASLGAEFTESIELDETLRNTTLRVMEHLDAQAASVFLLNPQGTHLICRFCAGPIDVTGLSIPFGKGILSRAMIKNSLQTVLDVTSDEDFNQAVDVTTNFVTRSILCAPLAMKGKPFGAIEIINKTGPSPLFTTKEGRLLSALSSLAAFAIHHARMTEERLAQEALRQEIALAGQIQRSLLPKDPAPNFPLFGINVPAQEISGDFYSHLLLPDGRIAFSLGDVSGKGIRASMLMSKTISLFQCLCKTHLQPGRLLAAINDEVIETSSHGMFVTMIAGLYDPQDQLVVFANAGHLPPILRQADGVFVNFDADMPPLGILGGIEFADEFVALQGGSLYLYSDGVTEAGGEQELGDAGLKTMINAFSSYPLALRLRRMVEQLKAGSQPLNDDITLLTIEAPAHTHLASLNYPADPACLKDMRHRVRQLVTDAGGSESITEAIVVALNEACMNVIQHGYQGDAEQEYELQVAYNKNRNVMVFELLDHAPRVDPARIKSRSLDDVRPGGLGVHFIGELMDEMAFCEPPPGYGNLLHMSVRLDKQTPLEMP
ncbi:MAG: SpoIIE family protein phosphatase [Rhodoferax sp.]|uniref:ATP-binding SpoIIE family protein phosphatase n=1 Tax=Rhodoferax sp. TaxID=50421 RepID=UPI0027330A9D|nr:SpoIIE family protein phosphatase [Rhodoferax sp.]MDP2680821.1 SpoIIE family protein phosphatase [Rhodoferax sp.]